MRCMHLQMHRKVKSIDRCCGKPSQGEDIVVIGRCCMNNPHNSAGSISDLEKGSWLGVYWPGVLVA